MRLCCARTAVWSAFVLALASAGCSTFERDWQAALRHPVPGDPLAGAWEGTWESQNNCRHGTLRAVIVNCGDGRYYARYRASYGHFLPFAFDTLHSGAQTEGVTQFHGEESLGCLAGGAHRYSGWADGTCYEAAYEAGREHGVFRMRRAGATAVIVTGGDVAAPQEPSPPPAPPSPAPSSDGPPLPPPLEPLPSAKTPVVEPPRKPAPPVSLSVKSPPAELPQTANAPTFDDSRPVAVPPLPPCPAPGTGTVARGPQAAPYEETTVEAFDSVPPRPPQ